MYRMFFVGLLLALPQLVIAADNWPEFRGPHANGHADGHGLPISWAEGKNIVWKTRIHDKGWSSPVIWDNQIWMTTALENGKQLFAVCVDRTTGKIVYDLKVFDVAKPAFCHAFNSYASPTPAIEGGRVYVHFGSAGTACIDTATGKTLWTRTDFVCDHYRGAGSSPILYRDLLILTFDGYDRQYVAALDKKSGKTVWKKDRHIAYPSANADYRKAYGTPVVLDVDGRQQLISNSAEATIAYDPNNGDELWRVKHGGMNTATRPLYGRGKIYMTTGAGGDQLIALRPEIKPAGDRIVWKCKKAAPTRPSPLLIDDCLYMVSDGGVASCVDADTGKPIAQVRLKGQFSASPVYADGRIYFVSQDGAITVVEAGRELKILSVNELDDGCMASPAVSGSSLFVRTRTHLYRIEK